MDGMEIITLARIIKRNLLSIREFINLIPVEQRRISSEMRMKTAIEATECIEKEVKRCSSLL